LKTRRVSNALFAIVLITTSSLIVGASFTLARGQLGLVKAYGPGAGNGQPYEPIGPWIDGIQIPQFLFNQNNEWFALKSGTIDLYDWPLTPGQISEYNSNPCIAAPDAPLGIAPCGAGQAPIQHEIALLPVQAFNKYQIDMQNAAFPTNLLAFRQAVAYATDKESFIRNTLAMSGSPNYAIVGCPALCSLTSGLWAEPHLNEVGLSCTSVAGTPMPYGCGNPNRFVIANAILDAAGLVRATTANCGTNTLCQSIASSTATLPGGPFRVDLAPGCASRVVPNGAGSLITVNDCGAALQPVFYVRRDLPNREALGLQLRDALQFQLGIDMDAANCGASCFTGDFQNFFDGCTRLVCFFTEVFGNFAYNLFTGSWSLGRDPTYIDDLYDSRFIGPFQTNYPNYNDPVFDTDALGLRTAQAGPPSDPFANARSFAYAAELEFNATLPVVDVWTDTAPHAIRIVHGDPDPVLNGLSWEGFQNQVGVGPHNGFSWLNVHLVGAPLHDPNHPVFMKWGWKTDLLASPNPVDSSFPWDSFADGLTYDKLNNLATDDASFAGDLPWAASLPAVTVVAAGALFPNGEVCMPDAPANVCSVLSYRLRPDLTFAASLDGSTAAIPVTANDIRFSILDSRSSPTSFLGPRYLHVQDVVVQSLASFDVYERTGAVWDRHDLGDTPILSVQHWCLEAHDSWPGTTLANCLAAPTGSGFGGLGWPDAGVNVLSSTSGHQIPGPAVGVDLGSNVFAYDSEVSFSGNMPNGPILYRLRQTPGLSLPAGSATCQPTGIGCGYSNPTAPSDAYFTNVLGATSAGLRIGGWHKFHLAGNINWYCTATTPMPCSAGITSETGPLAAPDMVINVIDLAIVAVHFGETPGTATNPCLNVIGGCPYGAQPWDLSGPGGTPDGTVNIFDLTRVAQHFAQSYLGGTDLGGGAVGTLPGWIYESIPGT
jgi:hypothetical protein